MLHFKDLPFEQQEARFEEWKKGVITRDDFMWGLYEFEGQFYGFWNKEDIKRFKEEMC